MGSTVNFNWNYGNEFDDPWWNTWVNMWTLVDAKIFTMLTNVTTDITITSAGKGLVVTTPDGTKTFRIYVNNSGILSIIEIT